MMIIMGPHFVVPKA